MQALQPTEVLSTLEAAGLRVHLTPECGLMVTPASGLNDTLRAVIREYKPMLIEHLRKNASNDAGELEHELFEERAAIMAFDGGLEIAQAEKLALLHTQYLIHHWKCPTCTAAGQGRGERCVTGSALWAAYDDRH